MLHFGPRKMTGLRFAGRSNGIAERSPSRGSQWCGGGGGTDVCRRAQQFPFLGWQFLVPGSLSVLVVAISLGFEFNPAWLVLTFAELGLQVVAMAFRCLERHVGDYECMIFRGDQVVIERGDRGGVSRFEFNRDSAPVVFREPRGKERAGWHCGPGRHCGPMETKWSAASTGPASSVPRWRAVCKNT